MNISKNDPTLRHRRACKVLAFALLLAPWLFAGSAWAQTEINRQIDASNDGLVTIENFAGSIVVRGWDRSSVAVSGTLGRDVKELKLQGNGSQVRIEVDFDKRRSNITAHLEIQVPKGSSVSIETLSAETLFDGVEGELRVESVSGDVSVEGQPQMADFETVSGNVSVRSPIPRLKIESVSGSVELLGVTGDVDVTTVSGSIEVRSEEIQKFEAELVSGNLKFVGSLLPGSEMEVSSHSGQVMIYLPRSQSASFQLNTFSGDIDNQLGPAARRASRYTSEKELSFEMGDGDAEVQLESFSGSISLRPRD